MSFIAYWVHNRTCGKNSLIQFLQYHNCRIRRLIMGPQKTRGQRIYARCFSVREESCKSWYGSRSLLGYPEATVTVSCTASERTTRYSDAFYHSRVISYSYKWLIFLDYRVVNEGKHRAAIRAICMGSLRPRPASKSLVLGTQNFEVRKIVCMAQSLRDVRKISTLRVVWYIGIRIIIPG